MRARTHLINWVSAELIMAGSMDVVPQNGFPLTNPLKLTSDIYQYDRLLKLRDDIVAGIHPRIKLNAAAATNGNSHNVAGNNGLHANGIAQANLTNTNAFPGLQPSPKPVQDLSSKIRTERQRIERDIRESIVKNEKGHTEQRGFERDVLADFDVSEIFFQAQDTAKALSQQTKQAVLDNVSGDEETFYSSGVGTDATDDLNTKNLTSRPPCKRFFKDGTCTYGDVCKFSHDPAFKQQLQTTGSRREKAASRHGYTAQGGRIRESPNYENTEEGEVLADETPYSPATHIAVEDLSRMQTHNPVSKPRGGFNNTPPNGSRANNRQKGKYPIRGKDTQIVRNHITSPAAPQPSRISPLAVAKVSRIDGGARNEQNRAGLQNREPYNHQPQGPDSRKRRREDGVNDNVRNVAPRTTLASPEPYIKPEPMSPPPFSSIPDQNNRQYDIQSRNNDRSPLQGIPNIGNDRMTPRTIPTPFEARRSISGPGPAPDSRRHQDLRRIVSTRNFERAGSPGYEAGYRPGTASRGVLAREEVQPTTYRASMQPPRQSYVVDDRSLSPPIRYARRLEEQQQPELISMPPPSSGRVVVDKYGNRYLETMMSDRRDVMMPETRYVTDVRQPTDNIGSIRGSVRPETYVQERRIYQSEAPQSLRANVGPELRYVEERSRPYDTLPRGSVRPESRYQDERFTLVEPEVSTRVIKQISGTRPEPRPSRMSTKPSSEHFNLPSRVEEGMEYDSPSQMQQAQSRRIRRPSLEYRSSAQPIARSIYESKAPYQPQQEYPQSSGVRYLHRRDVPEVQMMENIGRMSVRPMDDDLRRASVRPVMYDERVSRQSIDPGRIRYQEVREGEIDGQIRRPPYGRQEFIDPPPGARTAYRYVSTAREPAPTENTYDSRMYLD